MGLSSSKTKSTQDTNQTQSGTTMPITPDWVTQGLQDYTQRIGAFGDADPNSMIAGASPLQQQSWANASQLGGWRPQANTAANLALQAGTSGANTAGKYGAPMPQVAQGQQQPFNDGAGLPGMAFPSPQGKADPGRVTETRGFLPADPALVSGQGYSAAPSMPGYGQPRPGQPYGYTPQNDNPAITGASQMGAYQNPYQQQVIDTTLQGYDQNTGQQQAAMAAAAARNGAFGGSRYGIAEGQFAADAGLGRAQTEAQLRAQGFNTAAGYGMQDAASGNNMLQFDAMQRDNAANRQLAAAGLLGQQASQYGADTRADLGTMSALGDQQRGIEQAYAAAPAAQLQMLGQLYGATPYQVLTGQQVDTTGTAHSTGTQTSSPSLFNSLLSLGSLGLSAFGGFGGGGVKK